MLVFPQLRLPNERFFTPSLLVLGVSGAAAAITLACSIAGGRLALAWFDLALAGYFMAKGLAWLVNPGDTAQIALSLAVEGAAVLLLLAASVTAREPCRAERITGVVVVMGALVAAVALLEALGMALPWEGIRRPQSTLGNRNFVGGPGSRSCCRSPVHACCQLPE